MCIHTTLNVVIQHSIIRHRHPAIIQSCYWMIMQPKGGFSPLLSYIYQFIIKCLDFYNELIWLISNKEHGENNGTLPRFIYALSCIRQKHCRVVAFSRCFVIKGRMASFKVIGVDISSNSSSGFLDVVIQRQISFFILEAAEPSLNHDVVSPTAFSIHNLPFLDLDIPV